MSVIGFQQGANPSTWQTIGPNSLNQFAFASPAFVIPEPGWITHVGLRARDSGSGARLWLGVYSVAENGEPYDLLGRSARMDVSNAGSNHESAIVATHVTLGGPSTAIRVEAGQLFMIGGRIQDGSAEIGLVDGGAATLYRRTVAADGPPTDRFNPTSSAGSGLAGGYVLFVPDNAPAVSLSSPAAGAFVSTLTPTLVGAFTDPDSVAPTLDTLREYAIELREQGSTDLIWGGSAATFPASAAEKSAAAFSRPYTGTTLAGGATYEWRAQVADSTGAYSAWSDWRAFTINQLGVVTIDGDALPVGKVDTASELIDWTAKWHHPQAHSTDRAQVRVLIDGELFKRSPEITKTVVSAALPGTLFTITDVQAAIGDLEPGDYTFQIRGRSATGSEWSPWSDEAPFSINHPPEVPANLQPVDGAVSTSRPLLEFTSEDPDADDVPPDELLWEIEITRPNASVVTVETTTWDAETGIARFQTTSTEVNAFGVYRWRARALDVSASLYSQWSKQQRFSYVAGPVVTIAEPDDGDTVTTATPVISWTATGQTKYRVQLYRRDTATVFYNSGIVESASLAHQIPAGVLKNGNNPDVVVTVWDTFNVEGASLRHGFTVEYDPAVPLTGVQAVGYAYPLDPEPTAVLFTWDYSTYPPGEFVAYNVYRRRQGQEEDDRKLMRRVRNLGQNRWIDPHVASGQPLVYSVTQLRRIGDDVVESAAVEASFELQLYSVVISSVDDPGQRAILRWHMAGQEAGRRGSFTRPEQRVTPWGTKGKPTIIRGTGHQRVVDAQFVLISDQQATRFRHLNNLIDMWEAPPPTEERPSRGVVSFRDDFHTLFGQVTTLSYEILRTHVRVSLKFEETSYGDEAGERTASDVEFTPGVPMT